VWLAVLLAFGGALRVAYVLTVTRHDHHVYDAVYYQLEAASIGRGDGFVDPFAGIVAPGSKPQASAEHGPLTSLVLVPAGLVDDVDLSALLMRFTMVLVGLGSITVVGLLGRELGGDTVGLIAAGIAVVDPNLWMNDGLIMSESLSILLVAAILLLSYRVLRDASPRRILGLAVLCGLVTLVRAELAALTLLLAVPAVWIGSRGRRQSPSRRAAWAFACVAVAALLVAPWVGYNLTRFDKATFVSTNDGLTMVAANCDPSYYGPKIGSGDIEACATNPPKGDPSVVSAEFRSRALDYMGSHLGRWPVVVVARVARLWSIFHVSQTVGADVGEGRPRWASYAGVLMTYLLVAAAIFGFVVSRRRKIPVWPMVVPVVVVTAMMLMIGGIPRYRAAAEPSVIVLAAIGIGALLARRSSTHAAPPEDTSELARSR
jgi:hypothetical protein